MCGIVVYYGDAENRLTRVLTGMWAIIYRAPDSTGIGMLGSRLEPIRIRRELGSVENLIERLMADPLFEEEESRELAVMGSGPGRDDRVAKGQQRLLTYEGFSFPLKPLHPRWCELTDTDSLFILEPGSPGSPRMEKTFDIDSPKALKNLIDHLVTVYDLPLAVVEKLIKKGFETRIDVSRESGPLPVAPTDLFHEFDQIFHRFAYDEGPAETRVRKNGPKNPLARKSAWQLLRTVSVTLPADYTVDGIANLFRYLDSWVLIDPSPDTADQIQLIFENFWTLHNSRPPGKWQTLFQTEKNFNVYGLAAAAVLAYFQTKVYMKNTVQADETGYLPRGHVPGPTHPDLLRFMAQPVIGQGRWAIQSAISVKNAHPFLDGKKERAVVLNGQFDSDVETRIQDYLTRVAGFSLRTTNSTELFAMLWGYYFDTASGENRRYKIIEEQHRLGLEDISSCSQSIDYTIFKNLSGKSLQDIDEMAFIQAVEAMIPSGGQFAVSGISRISPDRLFVAAHRRPIYIVKRRETSDFMVVSDINAALGLFPQTLIQETRVRLGKLMKTYSKKSVIVESDFFDKGEDTQEAWFRREKMSLLKPFLVDIFALDQERIFAKIQTESGKDGVARSLSIRDFSGKVRKDIRPDQTVLTPVSFQKDFGRTFYEEHLLEIPGLFADGLNRYTDPFSGLPRFDVKRRFIERRFGRSLETLNRIILVSTGFSYLLSEIVEKNMEQFFTGINIVVTTPLDISETGINPDRDLVVMISWSGTTSDMIDCASLLLKKNILMVGITEKPFSDLALVTRKSAGVIPVLCGEEVTVAPLKSAVCLLLTTELFCLYLCGATPGKTETISGLVGEMKEIPEHLQTLLMDDGVLDFCRNAAPRFQNTRVHTIVDAFHDSGAGKAGALNLELNAWTSMGNAVDYSEMDEFMAAPVAEDDMILVNATTQRRLEEAVRFMETLHKAGRQFLAVSFSNREQEEIEKIADMSVSLPKLPDHFQPFVDLTFMFLFGFYFGLAHGRLAGEMPRNMAKSVTAGRTKNRLGLSPSDVLDDMAQKAAALDLPPLSGPASSLCWIDQAGKGTEKEYYNDLVVLGQAFHEPDPFSSVFSNRDTQLMSKVSRLIFHHLAEDGIMIFVPLDKEAEAGCRNFIRLWDPFLSIPLQVEFPEKIKGVSTEDSLMVAVASQPPAEERLAIISAHSHENLLWIGPETNGPSIRPFACSLGAWFLARPDLTCCHEHLYTALTLFFSRVMALEFPGRSKGMEEHFKLMLPQLCAVLDNAALRQRIHRAILENLQYDKQLFVSGFQGNCTSWQTGFGRGNPRGVESESFGICAYHHLVMVDPRVGKKFVNIGLREAMLAVYPEKEILAWEHRYLTGTTMDDFLKNPSMPIQQDSVLPFYIDDQWYLPVLRPGYDAGQDCLVILDATSESQFDAALDDLATFGSRYARIIVITQQGFARDARLANLKKYPLSHILLLPGIPEKSGAPGIISDFLLPVMVNLVGSAMKFMADPGKAKS
ncbi:SIS domain-containing protein [Desulfospira joergensenii]|uniref:SIS domain-containing protein n=1 Tax=Desulfospira joergensenii TaxID=53329 RepID=UPI0003B5D5E7|nr:SIS domain-containing protein [Desulfospira joergensenii]